MAARRESDIGAGFRRAPWMSGQPRKWSGRRRIVGWTEFIVRCFPRQPRPRTLPPEESCTSLSCIGGGAVPDHHAPVTGRIERLPRNQVRARSAGRHRTWSMEDASSTRQIAGQPAAEAQAVRHSVMPMARRSAAQGFTRSGPNRAKQIGRTMNGRQASWHCLSPRTRVTILTADITIAFPGRARKNRYQAGISSSVDAGGAGRSCRPCGDGAGLDGSLARASRRRFQPDPCGSEPIDPQAAGHNTHADPPSLRFARKMAEARGDQVAAWCSARIRGWRRVWFFNSFPSRAALPVFIAALKPGERARGDQAPAPAVRSKGNEERHTDARRAGLPGIDGSSVKICR